MEKNKVYTILQRLVDHTIPSEHRNTIKRWLASDKDMAEKETALQRIWMETNAEADKSISQSLAATRQKIRMTTHQVSGFYLRVRLLRYAAILLLPLITGTTVWFVTQKQYREPDMIECYVPNGQQQTVQLPDGSSIQLNSGSLLIYPRQFEGKRRTVYLRGEAKFSVARNTYKPFIVSTGPLKVEVLGTKFNIESYPENKRIVTTLEQGSVKVYKNEQPEQSIVMKPDEQLVYNKQNETFNTLYVNASDCSAWTNSELRFVNQPLTDILATMERRYDVRFKISPDIKSSDLFTMKFKKHETIEDAMHIFTQLAGNINYRIEGQEILLFHSGKGVSPK